jgi:hypothetical protein
MGVRVRRTIFVSATLALAGVPVGVSAAQVPHVSLPTAPVAPPSLPAPPVAPPPAPVPLPQPPASLPHIPVTPPSVATPRAPGDVSAETIGQAVGQTVTQIADGSRDAVATAGRTGAAAAAGHSRGKADRGGAADYSERQRLVRRYRGCLDNLEPLQAHALILRYGIGRSRPQSRARAASRLGISQRRFDRVRRRGLRRLVRLGRTTGCEHTGVGEALLVFGSVDSGMGDRQVMPVATGGAATAPADRDVSGVLGAHASGGKAEEPKDRPLLGLAPPAAGGDKMIALLIALLALTGAAVMWLVARRRRHAGSHPYEWPR